MTIWLYYSISLLLYYYIITLLYYYASKGPRTALHGIAGQEPYDPVTCPAWNRVLCGRSTMADAMYRAWRPGFCEWWWWSRSTRKSSPVCEASQHFQNHCGTTRSQGASENFGGCWVVCAAESHTTASACWFAWIDYMPPGGFYTEESSLIQCIAILQYYDINTLQVNRLLDFLSLYFCVTIWISWLHYLFNLQI